MERSLRSSAPFARPVTSIFPIMIAISGKNSQPAAGPGGFGPDRATGKMKWRAGWESMKDEETAFFRRARGALSRDAFVLQTLGLMSRN